MNRETRITVLVPPGVWLSWCCHTLAVTRRKLARNEPAGKNAWAIPSPGSLEARVCADYPAGLFLGLQRTRMASYLIARSDGDRMAKLYFHYSTMNAGKSTLLLQASHNYRERGMNTYLLTAKLDHRAGQGRIGSRIGLGAEADTFQSGDDLFGCIQKRLSAGPVDCVFIDEAQFLTKAQVWQLARAVDDLGVPIMCYGLRVDFQGELFPGSAALLALADEMREVRTICHCGKKATMVTRQDENGNVLTAGEQVQIGGNETYVSLCRRHWREAVGDRPTS